MTSPDDRVEILLVEDDEGYAFLTLQYIELEIGARKVSRACDAQEALELIESGVSCPDLILLDIRLPGMSGLEFLEQIRADDRFSEVPVVILTNSSARDDVKNAYALGANCYVTKPNAPDQLRKLLAAIQEFWVSIALLPSKV